MMNRRKFFFEAVPQPLGNVANLKRVVLEFEYPGWGGWLSYSTGVLWRARQLPTREPEGAVSIDVDPT